MRPATRPGIHVRRAHCGGRCGSRRANASPSAGSARSRSRGTASARRSRSAGERLRLAPGTARTYGVIGDALHRARSLRRGLPRLRHDGRSSKPSLAAYARVSYARELLGRPERRDRCHAARRRGRGETSPRPTAWTRVQLGKLYWSIGRLAPAARPVPRGAGRLPGLRLRVRRARTGRGGARTAPRARSPSRRGPSTRSRCRSSSRCSATSTRAHGQRSQARRQYALIGVIQRLLVANGVKTDLETALFDVDHGVRLRHALSLARLARADRPSIDGDDVLAWALARNGRCVEAPTTRSARCASARSTRSSSSTAG